MEGSPLPLFTPKPAAVDPLAANAVSLILSADPAVRAQGWALAEDAGLADDALAEALVEPLWERAREAQELARVRTVSKEHAGIFAARALAARAFARAHGLGMGAVDVRVDGGFVERKYAFNATTTILEMKGDQIEIYRGAARRLSGSATSVAARVRVPAKHPRRAEILADLRVARYQGGYATLA